MFLCQVVFGLPERSKQSAALRLPMWGASWPTSLQKFQASKATLKPSLCIPGSPTAEAWLCCSADTREALNTRSTFSSNTNNVVFSIAIPGEVQTSEAEEHGRGSNLMLGALSPSGFRWCFLPFKVPLPFTKFIVFCFVSTQWIGNFSLINEKVITADEGSYGEVQLTWHTGDASFVTYWYAYIIINGFDVLLAIWWVDLECVDWKLQFSPYVAAGTPLQNYNQDYGKMHRNQFYFCCFLTKYSFHFCLF